MSDNPALDALVRDKIAQVEADMKARYGHALGEYFFNGVFDPILKEIGYDGSEVQMTEFAGLSSVLADATPTQPKTEN
jgi:hypothetical protein